MVKQFNEKSVDGFHKIALSQLSLVQLISVYRMVVTPFQGESPRGMRKSEIINDILERATEWQMLPEMWEACREVEQGYRETMNSNDWKAEFKKYENC